ncbi:hypothetical protein [Syntrophomonas wolfei]|uniref:hypothetical protein n=1 Tax=Syntrophomonas wolfei TaxID=863 RepID=UPI000057440E|nr:hypothetical protein [Syntrophomonas wolfei]
MMKFLELRIADPNLLRLIKRFLKAGVMEAGIVYDTPKGTPQGGIILLPSLPGNSAKRRTSPNAK